MSERSGTVDENDPADLEPAVPTAYPLIAVLIIVIAGAPTTWLFPAEPGYLLAGGALGLVAVYGVIFTNVRLTTDGIFLALFGGYWVGLLVHYHHAPHQELLFYILSTPVAVVATVIVLPQFVVGRPQTFAMALTTVATLLVLFGVSLVWLEHTTDAELPRWVGMDVMGYGEYRTVSIYNNPNPFGIVMMVGTLTAAYTYLTRRGPLWLGALAICLLGFVLAEGDAGFVGFIVGFPILLSAIDRRLSIGAIGASVLAAYVGIRIGHVGEVMRTTFLGRVYRDVEKLERLSENPMLGIGFGEDGILAYDPHNSFLHVPLAVGVIPGSLYVFSLLYALAKGLRARWTPWTGYVVGTAAAMLISMWFESLTLGGVSVTPVLLGLYVGLLLQLGRNDHGRPPEADSLRSALRRSRVGRVVGRIRG
ncbi:O-antigen ligase [Halovivax sp.]|uniref:O-antigen ligase family protein n=1 Tax=Halovivax sp. TaxID=1935978 RepID=UPI0025B90D0E|nr:O-antigen ligase domain-containing protein [Halovivax sp.]